MASLARMLARPSETLQELRLDHAQLAAPLGQRLILLEQGGTMSARIPQYRLGKGDGEIGGKQALGNPTGSAGLCQVLQAKTGKGIDCSCDPIALLPRKERVTVETGRRKYVQWDIELSSPAVQRHKKKKPSDGLRHPAMACRMRCLCRFRRRQHEARQLDQSRCRFAGIAFQLVVGGKWVIVEIADPRINHCEERVPRQPMFFDRGKQGGSNRIAAGIAVRGSFYEVTPPLKADLAWQSLMHHVPYPGDLRIEGIECGKRSPLFLGGEKASEISVTIRIAERRKYYVGFRSHRLTPRSGRLRQPAIPKA